jgi:general secretion pathway protein N
VRRRTAAFAALGIAAYGVFLGATIPARLVTARLALPPGLALRDVDGSIWNGHASLSWQAGGATLAIDALRWHLRPLALLSARLAYDVDAQGQGVSAHAEVSRSLGAWNVEAARLQGDAAMVAAVIPLASAWQPAGRVDATATSLAWNGRELEGRAELQWLDAALAISPVRPLGSYTLKLEGAGGPARITLATTAGALRLSGDGTLDGVQRLAFTGEARAEGPRAADLTPLLDLLGPRRPDGSRALRYP